MTGDSFADRPRIVRFGLDYDKVRDFATLTGVGEDTITSIESSGRDGWTMENLKKLKNTTGFTADYFIFGDTSGLTPDQLRTLAKGRARSAASPRRSDRKSPKSAKT